MFIWLIAFLALASVANAQSKDIITYPSKEYGKGTTLNNAFVVPENNRGIITLQIPCDSKMDIMVRLEDADKCDSTGTNPGCVQYGGFGKKPGLCNGRSTSLAFIKVPPIAKDTRLRVRLTSQSTITKEVTLEFYK